MLGSQPSFFLCLNVHHNNWVQHVKRFFFCLQKNRSLISYVLHHIEWIHVYLYDKCTFMVRLSMDNITRIMTKDTNQSNNNERKKKIKLMSGTSNNNKAFFNKRNISASFILLTRTKKKNRRKKKLSPYPPWRF